MDEQGACYKRLIPLLASATRTIAPLLFISVVACSMFAVAEATDTESMQTQSAGLEKTTVPVELYQGPKILKSRKPKYPVNQIHANEEGWVVMQYMVDTAGKPYEISVVDSVGSNEFAKAATKALQRFTFQPATIDGQPIDAGNHHKVTFSLAGGTPGAKSHFVRKFRKLSKAIAASDKVEADALFAELNITNLYEDAFYNYLRISYYAKWGTPRQSLAAVRRAVAHEKSDTYLRGTQYLTALQAQFALEVQLSDFAAAEATAALLLEHEKDETRLAVVKNAMKQIGELRHTDEKFRLTANLGERTSWWFGLFRNNFQVSVVEGKISELKLRCRKGYVFFRYDPELEYTIPEDRMPCRLEVLGDPGTEFSIVQ